MKKLSLRDLPIEGKKIIMRVDFNVPLNKDGSIGDDTRIRESLPSIKYVLEKGGKLVLMSHLGKSGASLAPCAKRLSELLGKPVDFPDGTGNIILLENLRQNPAEEDPKKDPQFAKNLAELGDFYVNDAFGTAHRKHSSTYEIAEYFHGKAAMGFLMEKEYNYLTSILENPKTPFFAIVGGSKVSSKIGVLKSLIKKADKIFIGGAMAYTFLKAQGLPIGDSLCENEQIELAKELLKSGKIHLPKDTVIENTNIVSTIPSGAKGMDIGPETIKEWSLELQNAKTIFWNGPLGVFETPPFDKGTSSIAHTLANLKNATTIVGGGDSAAAINALNLASKFSHISTGGGASLELIEFGHLPGIDVLSNKIEE